MTSVNMASCFKYLFIAIDLMLIQLNLAGKACVYSYNSDYRVRFAYRFCVTDCCRNVGSFVCCIKGSHYKYFQIVNNRPERAQLNVEAIAAIVVGSLVGLIVFIGILAVLYIDYTRGLIWFKRIEVTDIHEEKSQDDDNHKTEQKYLETHFL